MNEQLLLDRILNDARKEAKRILAEAKDRTKGNVEYARQHAKQEIDDAGKNAKKTQEHANEIAAKNIQLHHNMELLRQKREIVDRVFEEAKKDIKFNWRVEKKENFELHLTQDELFEDLRDHIEAKVAEILFA